MRRACPVIKVILNLFVCYATLREVLPVFAYGILPRWACLKAKPKSTAESVIAISISVTASLVKFVITTVTIRAWG